MHGAKSPIPDEQAHDDQNSPFDPPPRPGWTPRLMGADRQFAGLRLVSWQSHRRRRTNLRLGGWAILIVLCIAAGVAAAVQMGWLHWTGRA
jgi:hypothetical protein